MVLLQTGLLHRRKAPAGPAEVLRAPFRTNPVNPVKNINAFPFASPMVLRKNSPAIWSSRGAGAVCGERRHRFDVGGPVCRALREGGSRSSPLRRCRNRRENTFTNLLQWGGPLLVSALRFALKATDNMI